MKRVAQEAEAVYGKSLPVNATGANWNEIRRS